MRLLLLLIPTALLLGCASPKAFHLETIEVGVNGGVKMIRSDGENFASSTTGYYEEEGQWYTGGDLRFIFGRDK